PAIDGDEAAGVLRLDVRLVADGAQRFALRTKLIDDGVVHLARRSYVRALQAATDDGDVLHGKKPPDLPSMGLHLSLTALLGETVRMAEPRAAFEWNEVTFGPISESLRRDRLLQCLR